jgi:hypothetical protein
MSDAGIGIKGYGQTDFVPSRKVSVERNEVLDRMRDKMQHPNLPGRCRKCSRMSGRVMLRGFLSSP